VLVDRLTGTLLKVGKTTGPYKTLYGRFKNYARAGRALNLSLELKMWRVTLPPGVNTAETIENQARNTLLDLDHDLPWDNKELPGIGFRLQRNGPGIPFVTNSFTRANGWSWQADPNDANYGRLVNSSGTLVPQSPPYYP
jgi:hypothetical protein